VDCSGSERNWKIRNAKDSFPPSETFWIFLSQVMAEDGSCREALRKFLARLFIERGRTASPNTAGYVKARARLDRGQLEEIQGRIARRAERGVSDRHRWLGRRVMVVDGSSVSMPDTPENQAAWPQPPAQKPGCGFPVMRVVALFSLASGAMLGLARDALTVHERLLFKRLWPLLGNNDVLLSDRGFCSFADIFCLSSMGVDCVMRKHQARKKGQGPIKKLGKNDRLVRWTKTAACPTWMTREQWKQMPETMVLREIKVAVPVPGFRSQTIFIVTTLLDHKEYPAEAFAELYRRRWRAELHLRDIKTTMGMEILRCKSPAMVEKELMMHLIAYNLIRSVMLQASQTYHQPVEGISFKGTVSTIRQWAPYIEGMGINSKRRAEIYDRLLYYLAKDKLPHRPNRVEPRARKRRNKSYQLMTKPRSVFKEIPHRERYRKA
jgi:hypothetical protein